MAEINLLPVEEKEAERFKLLQKRLTVASVVFLVVTAILTLATLIFFTSVSRTRQNLNERVEETSTKINSLKSTEELIVVIKKKAQAADKILNLRTDYPEVFERLSQLIPQGVYFTDLKVSADKMIFSGRAKTSADVAGLVSSLLSAEGSKAVSGVTVDSLISDEKGVYSFVITTQLVGGSGTSPKNINTGS